MSDVIDISEPLREISDRLGLEYNCLKRLVITPLEAVATVYRKNEDGAKYINLDTGWTAIEERVFKVRP